MDAKVFRMALITIISALVLVLLIVYATNADKINGLLGKDDGSNSSAEEATALTSEEMSAYGEQIGDNLGGFMLDEEFFDETEEIPSIVVIKKSSASSSDDSGEVLIGDDGIGGRDNPDDATNGSGMAVVGQLDNPNTTGNVDEDGFLTSVPPTPPGGFGEYIPNGSVVGTP